MWPKWVRSGETSEFRVHAVEQYQLTLWRYGLQKEYVAMIGWLDEHGPQANRQILPDGDFTQTGIKWNSDGYPAPPTIVAPERSGLYYLWARTPSGQAFSFPWVVAPAKPRAPIAVLASTNTWNAYNAWPSHFSVYTNPKGTSGPWSDVSFDRPYGKYCQLTTNCRRPSQVRSGRQTQPTA